MSSVLLQIIMPLLLITLVVGHESNIPTQNYPTVPDDGLALPAIPGGAQLPHGGGMPAGDGLLPPLFPPYW